MEKYTLVTNFWRIEGTKTGKTILKVFDTNCFVLTVFVVKPDDKELIGALQKLVNGGEYTFVFNRSYSGFGTLFRITLENDDETINIYTI